MCIRDRPDAFDFPDDFPDDAPEELADAFEVPLARAVDFDEDARFCFDAERFLDGPHVDMTLHTVPTGCRTERRPCPPGQGSRTSLPTKSLLPKRSWAAPISSSGYVWATSGSMPPPFAISASRPNTAGVCIVEPINVRCCR